MKKCKVEGCNGNYYGKGYCKKHWQQEYRSGAIGKEVQRIICKVEGCNSISIVNGYCNRHDQQVRKFGEIRIRTNRDPNEFIFDGDICKIKLYNNKNIEVAEAIIDAEDYEKCKDKKWYAKSDGYVVSGNSKKGAIYLQHLIFGGKIQLDHKDTDKLNNRKSNLRPCTTAQNCRNCKISKNNTSGYKGVSWNKSRKKWVADIMHNYKHICLGEFIDKIDAAKAYNEAALKYHGEFAKLNQI